MDRSNNISTYIYLNKYKSLSGREYYYIGSHTWKGPVNEVDPNYQGSSLIAKRYKWVPYSIEILENIDRAEQDFIKRESYWIHFYCSLYGIADCAKVSSHNKEWSKKYGDFDGKMLNLHNNTCDHLIEITHTPEIIERQQKSRELHSNYKQIVKDMVDKMLSAEAKEKSYNTRLKSGKLHKWVASGQQVANTPSACTKRKETILRNKSNEHAAQLRKERAVSVDGYGKRKVCSVYKDSVLIETGNLNYLCRVVGSQNWAIKINRDFAKGLTEVAHHGFVFKFNGYGQKE